MSDKGKNYYDVTWWESFSKKLSQFNKKRNSCCHPNPFNWQLLQELLDDEFKPDDPQIERTPKINGVFFESMIGTEL